MRVSCLTERRLRPVQESNPLMPLFILRPDHRFTRITVGRFLGLLPLACMNPLPGMSADADDGWLRLERINTEQRRDLKTRQQQYSKSVQPLPLSDQRQLNRQFRQQQQRQDLLQDKQLRERSLLRQRQRVSPEFNPSTQQNLNLQRSRQQQQNLQNHLRQQRRTWPYGR